MKRAGPIPPPRQRVAARLLLAACILALGLGLGTAIAVLGVLGLHHPRLLVHSPDQVEGRLDAGVHELFVVRNDVGGDVPVEDSGPVCTVVDVRSGATSPMSPSGTGFAKVRVLKGGRQRVTCTSIVPVTVDIEHQGKGTLAYLAAIGRGLAPAVALTLLAALLAAKALVAVRRLRSDGTR